MLKKRVPADLNPHEHGFPFMVIKGGFFPGDGQKKPTTGNCGLFSAQLSD